jgi:oligopeptide/dipeptide ABC transporter ATP-binding protein
MADRVAVLYAGRIVEIGPVAEILNRPSHPYTDGLMRATPPMHGDGKQLRPIPGAMPNLGSIPAGCAFHPRCPRAGAECPTLRPDLLYDATGGHACWHPINGRSAA